MPTMGGIAAEIIALGYCEKECASTIRIMLASTTPIGSTDIEVFYR